MTTAAELQHKSLACLTTETGHCTMLWCI